jgi:Holliday junction resolvase
MTRSKQIGYIFEHDLVEKLNTDLHVDSFKRVPGSGAIGTSMGEPSLTADIVGKIPGFPKKFKIECKAGYGGKTQLTLKRAWLEKIIEEASKDYSMPLLAGKFTGARNFKYFFVVPYPDMIYLLELVKDLQTEIDILYLDRKDKP